MPETSADGSGRTLTHDSNQTASGKPGAVHSPGQLSAEINNLRAFSALLVADRARPSDAVADVADVADRHRAIARSLGVEMSYFVGTPLPGQIVRRGSRPEHLRLGSDPVIYTRLSGRHEERKMEALLIEVPAGLASPTANREGEGFWYILEGALELWVGPEHFLLNPGVSAHFDQRHQYRMRNACEITVRMLWVCTPALL